MLGFEGQDRGTHPGWAPASGTSGECGDIPTEDATHHLHIWRLQGCGYHQDDPMVISVDIDRFTIRKTLVDQGSLVDILYWKTFKAMRIPEAEMVPYDDHVVGFSGERVGTKGYIELYTTFDQEKNNKTIRIRYLVIDANTSYNVLLD